MDIFKYTISFSFSMNYEEMLKKGREEIPKSVLESERFTIPGIKGHIQGNKTILSNFAQIASVLGREPEHLLKYVLKELATPGEIKKSGVIIGRKVSAASVNEKIKKYAEAFVICSECKKPDTKLNKDGRMLSLKCLACGAQKPVKA